jgi:hypothetical protein
LTILWFLPEVFECFLLHLKESYFEGRKKGCHPLWKWAEQSYWGFSWKQIESVKLYVSNHLSSKPKTISCWTRSWWFDTNIQKKISFFLANELSQNSWETKNIRLGCCKQILQFQKQPRAWVGVNKSELNQNEMLNSNKRFFLF